MTNNEKITITQIELQAMIERIKADAKLEFSRGNHLELGGIVLHSTEEPLQVLEQTAERLITKHGNFILLKRESQHFGFSD